MSIFSFGSSEDNINARKRSWNHVGLIFMLLGTCVLVCSVPVAAQSGRGAITGIVKDASGGIVPGVDVQIVEKSSGVVTQSTTTESGVYRAPYVPPGIYKVTASLAGFKTAVADNVNVLLGQTVTVDLTLEVGQVSEMVTVSAAAPLLETSSSEIGINANEKEVHTWPIIVGDGTRQLQSFVFRMMPGTQGGEFAGSINGGQSYSHEILFDGITIGRMDLNGGSNNEFTATMDAVSEFKLQTGALSSQYGNTQTALVNFGMKSGTNTYHGGVFWLHRDRSLNANSWSNNRLGVKKNPFLDNNGGATLGGPVWIPGLYKGTDKTHFFFSYELERFKNATSTSFLTLPPQDFRQGNFSRLLDPAFTLDARSGTNVGTDALGRPVIFGTIYDPNTSRLVGSTWVRDPFPGNIIPSSRFSRVVTNALKEDVPLPVLNQFRNNYPATSGCCPVLEIDNWSLKLDHVINTSHKVAGTYIENDRGRKRFGSGTPTVYPLPGPAMLGHRFQDTPGYLVRLSEDWAISPTMLNHFAYGYNRFHNRNQSYSYLDGQDWKTILGLTGSMGNRAFPRFAFAGVNATLTEGLPAFGDQASGSSPSGSGVVGNDFTWLRGNHSWRMGVEHRRYYRNNASETTTGSYTFHNENTGLSNFTGSTGFAYSSFLLGAVQSAGLGIVNLTSGIRSRTWGFYVQDDWKIRPNLTLNLGLRWDIPSSLTEAATRMSGLDPTLPNPGAGGRLGTMVFLGDCAACNGNETFADTYWKQFGPRIGFAWNPDFMNKNFVVRGGYGINYTPPILDGFSFPYTTGFNGSNPIVARSRGRFTEDPSYYIDQPYPAYTATLPNYSTTQLNGQGIGYYIPETTKMPYVQNWNFGIQFAVPWDVKLELNYVGNKGTRLNQANYLNNGLNMVDPKHLSLGNTLLESITLHPEIPLPYAGFTGTVAQALRPFPQYQQVQTHRMNGAYSTYHSAQLTVIKRMPHGLSFLAAYTFSKALGIVDTAGPGNYYDYGQNYYNRRADYSVTQYHVPSDLKLTWIFDLPFGPQGRWFRSGFMGNILGGWTMSMLHRYRSGNPLSIGAGGFDSQALFNGAFRGEILLPSDQWVLSTPTEINPVAGTPYLNSAAFGNPPSTNRNIPLRLGNAPRFLSQLRGFAVYTEDFSLTKKTDLGFREGASFELRMDAVNVFNRTAFSNPNTNTLDPVSFGKIFGKTNVGGPRNIQIGARINF